MIGHDAAVAAFKASFADGRPHHAWLLTGAQGLGKALFATRAATWVLAGQPAGEGFDGASASQAEALLASGAHPDFRRLERSLNDKGNLRAVITIDEIRALQPVLQQRPSLSDWRVIIVDSADELNPQAANALLKNLEEPHDKTLFLLVSHAPGRLLPTIRSRCRTLRFARLTDAQVDRILAREADDLNDEDRETLVRLAAGAPGRALRFADSGIAALERDLAALLCAHPATAPHQALALARSLSGKAAAPRYDAFLDLAPAMLAAHAARLDGAARARAIAAWETATRLAGGAGPLSLDPQAVVFEIASLLAGQG
jgi:DNA polymerase III subunit delta'